MKGTLTVSERRAGRRFASTTCGTGARARRRARARPQLLFGAPGSWDREPLSHGGDVPVEARRDPAAAGSMTRRRRPGPRRGKLRSRRSGRCRPVPDDRAQLRFAVEVVELENVRRDGDVVAAEELRHQRRYLVGGERDSVEVAAGSEALQDADAGLRAWIRSGSERLPCAGRSTPVQSASAARAPSSTTFDRLPWRAKSIVSSAPDSTASRLLGTQPVFSCPASPSSAASPFSWPDPSQQSWLFSVVAFCGSFVVSAAGGGEREDGDHERYRYPAGWAHPSKVAAHRAVCERL